MKRTLIVLTALFTAMAAVAQTTPRAGSRVTARTQKANLPDPALLDGSSLPAEQRADEGMLADFELPGGKEGERVGGEQSEQQGGSGNSEQEGGGQAGLSGAGGGSSEESEEKRGGGGSQEGLKGDQAQQSQGQGGSQTRRQRDVAIGDPKQQISRSAAAAAEDVVGKEREQTAAQEFEKPVAQGQQSNSGNKGVERGSAMPGDL